MEHALPLEKPWGSPTIDPYKRFALRWPIHDLFDLSSEHRTNRFLLVFQVLMANVRFQFSCLRFKYLKSSRLRSFLHHTLEHQLLILDFSGYDWFQSGYDVLLPFLVRDVRQNLVNLSVRD